MLTGARPFGLRARPRARSQVIGGPKAPPAPAPLRAPCEARPRIAVARAHPGNRGAWQASPTHCDVSAGLPAQTTDRNSCSLPPTWELHPLASRSAAAAALGESAKFDFTRDAVGICYDSARDASFFEKPVVLDASIHAAVAWAAATPPAVKARERERALDNLARRAQQLVASGRAEAWFAGAADTVRRVAATVNGPLCEALASELQYHDPECVNLFREGARISGDLPASGHGRAIPRKTKGYEDASTLLSSALDRNTALLASLKPDAHAIEILEQTSAESRTGRISAPVSVSSINLSRVILSPRFAVEQQRPGGKTKLRLVDDLSRSGINSSCRPAEKLRTEGIDHLFAVAQLFHRASGRVPALFKADIDAAYRRIPLAPCDQWAAWVVFLHRGEALAACHRAIPFGGEGSVHGWDRVGQFLAFVARRLLYIPALRYVDDYFSPELEECARHAMLSFARLVRILLGESAVAEAKLECGNPLPVLGLSVSLDPSGMTCVPLPEKREKWRARLGEALSAGHLPHGAASKLAGALMWASSNLFGRLGRAMVSPFFALSQKGARGRRLSNEARSACAWWRHVLLHAVVEKRAWRPPEARSAALFGDARGEPPHIAAVLFIDGSAFFCHAAVSHDLLRAFQSRKDHQISGLEMLSLALGIASFAPLLEGRRVHVYSDNTCAEGAVRKGRASAFDHNSVIHCIWAAAFRLRLNLYVHRVPSALNVADPPSRECFRLMTALHAREVPAALDPSFFDAGP